jgi:hypothetical protein
MNILNQILEIHMPRCSVVLGERRKEILGSLNFRIVWQSTQLFFNSNHLLRPELKR